MLSSFLNWRTGLALIAIIIVSASIWYSQHLAEKIAASERKQVIEWVEAGKLLLSDSAGISDPLTSLIITGNTSIPIIETDEKGSITQYINLDEHKIKQDSTYLKEKLREFSQRHEAIEWQDPIHPDRKNFYYYGPTALFQQVKYYPIVQLCIVGLFIIITLYALNTTNKSIQNQLWAGMAKETAHQLGTPLSSLQGWVELIKEDAIPKELVPEMEKDINRLKLVSDRFGKIGSIPQLQPADIIAQIAGIADYIQRRAHHNVQFEVSLPQHPVIVPLSPTLFDWVLENLLKNALDAMSTSGLIRILFTEKEKEIWIDVIDNGKGIPRNIQHQIFQPGFTTKKRGWGLGLSLARRIIDEYHQGNLVLVQSETGKGTHFRISLKKSL